MTLVKFNRKPLERNFNSLLDDFFTDIPAFFNNVPSQEKGFAPANIKESEKSYSIDIVAPGFDKADFKIDLDHDILSISAEKKDEVKKENEKEVRKEYSYRSFKRSFSLDEKIDGEAIDAKYVNGVLTLNLPKKEEVKSASKVISIQ